MMLGCALEMRDGGCAKSVPIKLGFVMDVLCENCARKWDACQKKVVYF